jgi:hypothetical protein
MNIQQRLQEINFWEVLLGRYTGALAILYSDNSITREYYISELSYILNQLIELKGIDDEDVHITRELLNSL